MVMSQRKPQQPRALGAEILTGVALGVGLAIFFACVAAVRLVWGAQGAPWREVLGLYGWAIAFYLIAGVLGGVLYGVLSPIRHLCVGKYLTAYLILLLVYGGGTATILPLLETEPVPVRQLLVVWAVLGLFLAPVYVWILKD
jgi:hypothetical protein